jgi:hypothetical protein
VANVKPPVYFTGAPATITLSAGSVLYRVHDKAYSAAQFNPNLTHRFYGGGRFDGTADDPYPYLYAGETVDVAVAETLLRDLPIDQNGLFRLSRRRIRNRRISAVVTTQDVRLVMLCSLRDLMQVAQDTWLTTCDPRDYAQSRHWGHWIRQYAPDAAGYVWMSRRDPTLRSYVLFGDRTPGGFLDEHDDPAVPRGDAADFDTPRGLRELKRRLLPYRVALYLR